MLKFVSFLKLLRAPDQLFLKRMSTAATVPEIASSQLQGIKRPYDQIQETSDNPSSESEVKRIKRRKFALLVSYSGLGYFGLQRNPGTKTIEDDILNALFKVGLITEEGLNQPQSFHFQRAARTDKGVSAIKQVLSARLPEELDLGEVNSLLPDQIRVMGAQRVTKGFNCKMNCDARTYSYTMPSFTLAPHSLFESIVLESDKIKNEETTYESSQKNEQIGETINPERGSLNSVTPSEISSCTSEEVSGLSDKQASETEAESEVDYSKMYAYRASPDLIEKTNQVLQTFLGTHNFHNFTSRRKPLDPSCQRYIINFTCSDPIQYDDMEFVTIRVKGQSFMLHQIRKMVGLAVAIVRGITTVETIKKAWDKQRLDLPIAPGLGLVLEEVHYDRYNKRYGQDGLHDPIDWSHLSKELDEFKNKFILSTILKTEKAQHSMCSWLKGLSQHSFDVRESGPPEKKDDKNSENGYESD